MRIRLPQRYQAIRPRGGFNPLGIANCVLCYSKGRAQTQDNTAGVTTISRWGNIASTGSDYDLVQTTKAVQPTYSGGAASTDGNLVAADADQMDVLNYAAAVNLSSAMTLVWRGSSLSGQNVSYPWIFSRTDNSIVLGWALQYQAIGSAAARFYINGTGINFSGTPLTTGARALLVAVVDAGSVTLYANGNAAGSGSYTPDATNGFLESTKRYVLGSRQDGGKAANINTEDLVVYSRALTSGELSVLHAGMSV